MGSDQLGHGSHENRLSVPQLLETLLPENGGGRAVMVSAANDRTCVVSDVGDLYTWGATAEKGKIIRFILIVCIDFFPSFFTYKLFTLICICTINLFFLCVLKS